MIGGSMISVDANIPGGSNVSKEKDDIIHDGPAAAGVQ